jgi:hypothetical protein
MHPDVVTCATPDPADAAAVALSCAVAAGLATANAAQARLHLRPGRTETADLTDPDGAPERPRSVDPGRSRATDDGSTESRPAGAKSARPGDVDGGPAWLRCADLIDRPAGLADWAARTRQWLRADYGEAPDRTVAGYLLGWYLGVPAATGAILFHTVRRVPELRPADLAFALDTPRPQPTEVALLAPTFGCLPDDPAAELPGATVVADEAALAELLRARFVAHAARFVPAFAAAINIPDGIFAGRLRLGRRTLWAAATDALDVALWVAGRDCADEAAGVADAALVLPAAHPPLTSASTLRPAVSAAERTPDTRWIRRRESCCFHYVLRDGAGECRTCPRVHPR